MRLLNSGHFDFKFFECTKFVSGLCSKLDSLVYFWRGKQLYSAILTFRNFEIVCYSARNFGQNRQYKDFRVFVCPSEDRSIFILMINKHPVNIMVFDSMTTDDDITFPFIFSHRFKLNTEAYTKCLAEVVLPESSW